MVSFVIALGTVGLKIDMVRNSCKNLLDMVGIVSVNTFSVAEKRWVQIG